MQTALPLVRSARNALIPSSSRIPHISYHILCKADQPRKARPNRGSQQQQIRQRSAVLHAADFNPSFQTESEAEKTCSARDESSPYELDSFFNPRTTLQADGVPQASDPSVSTATINDNAQLVGANDAQASTSSEVSIAPLLEEANADRILSWLEFHPAGRLFIHSANENDFDRAFCAVDPAVLLEPFKQALWHARGQGVAGDALRIHKSLVVCVRSFAQTIDNLLVARQDSGAKLTLPVCRHALKCAAVVGDRRMADHIWEKIMPTHNLEPDIGCYNAYMEAHVFNLGLGQAARTSFRATKRHLTLRSESKRPKHLWGYSTDPTGSNTKPTLKLSALALFQEISDKGLATTEETFTNLMVALARTGDINGPESILKSVWNIDVKLLESFDEEEIQSPTFYPDGHPLRPTSKMLWTVVHCYGVTSHAYKAWSLLDYISRNYALDIPDHVWNELVERTYVLSVRKSAVKRSQGQAEGQVPLAEIERLYQILTDEPYNIQSTPIISNLLARSYQQRRLRKKTVHTLRDSDKAMKDQIKKLQIMNRAFKDLTQQTSALMDNGMLSRSFLQLRHKFQMLYMTARLQLDLITVQAHRIIREDDFAGSGAETTWSRIKLPNFIEQLCHYLHQHVDYKTSTGRVRLNIRPDGRSPLLESDFYDTIEESHMIWNILNNQNLFEMASDLERLPRELDLLKNSRRKRHLTKLEGYQSISGFEDSGVD
ncbi:hypothetical protein H2198_009818 [Neophaeococcomyces mojaviensis]|uniref:Uncharacterized protein n=1 Tax=Neophaeococcomyces mojaviensis TaxID=3383035 RepID=A0ACC2ZTX4_9EURO|nr:hypothetical protein H2198_009818 [Knufia sp. JES_112]